MRYLKDRKRWMNWLFEAKKRYGLWILNYVVTSNHIRGFGVASLIFDITENQNFVFTNDVKIHFVQVAYRRVIMIVIWARKYMLRPVAHCRSGCMRKSINQ